MTAEQFVLALHNYYGKPKRIGIAEEVMKHLKTEIKRDRYEDLYGYILKTHTATALNEPFPSVKEIEDAVKHAQKEDGIDLRPGRESTHKPEIVPEEELMKFDSEAGLFAAIMSEAYV